MRAATLWRRPSVTLLTAAVAAFAGAGTVAAIAAIPGGSGQISSCYTKVGGVLRVIDLEAGQRCSSAYEKPLTWNQRGAEGVAGPQGVKGDPGPQGLQGANGVPGMQGPKGDPGPQGQAGTTQTQMVSGPVIEAPENVTSAGVVSCPGNQLVLSGGVDFLGPDLGQDRRIIGSSAINQGDSTNVQIWQVLVNPGVGDQRFIVSVICAAP